MGHESTGIIYLPVSVLMPNSGCWSAEVIAGGSLGAAGLFQRLTNALDAKRAEKDAAEERWLELAAEAEALDG